MTYHCRKCRIDIEIPTDISTESKAKVAALVRSKNPIQAIKLWRDTTGSDLASAKAISLHITPEKGICNRCNRTLPQGDAVECLCGSLNLDW